MTANSEALEIILKKLNPAQSEAVKTKNGPLLIIAGAGSGKTRVLTFRVAYLVASGVEPDNILALTFTNKAANEMKERIADILHPSVAKRIWAGTFHSIFARILRIDGELVGFTRDFTIYDTDDQNDLIKVIMNELGYDQKLLPPTQVRAVISSCKNKMEGAKDLERHIRSSSDKQIVRIFERYEASLANNNAMDFDDLLLNIIKLFNAHPNCLQKWQTRFKYIMVDEYQDTNKAQYMTINMLAKAHQNVAVVGDDAQSIYRWRGAEIQNILDFQKDYPYAKVVKLEQNYRSTQNILNLADKIIRNNSKRLEKKLFTDNPEGEKISIEGFETDRDEAKRVATKIKFLIGEGYDYKDFAVLYRTNAQSLAIEQALSGASLPYVVVGGLSFFKRKEVKDVLAYLRLLINKKDSVSLLRVVNEPPRGLGQSSIEHHQYFAQMSGFSLYEAMQNSTMNSSLQSRAVNSSLNFIKLIEEARSKIGTMPWKNIIEDYIHSSGLIKMYEEIDTDDSNDRLDNIYQLLSDLYIFLESNPELGVAEYLQQVSLISDVDQADLSKNSISLMTVHSAKGLEFSNVFIVGNEHGLFPSSRSLDQNEDLEEERRLMYVAITRAKENLYMFYAKQRYRFGKTMQSTPSMFLREADSEFVKWTPSNPFSDIRGRGLERDIIENNRPKYSEYSQIAPNSNSWAKPSPSLPKSNVELKSGDKVQHQKFGSGVITGLKGEGDNKQATVRFDSVGKKQLVLKFANLIKLN